MVSVSLKLLVLKTGQVDRLWAFYQALGVELAEERHGSGPVHYAGKVGEVVLEVYPLPAGATADTTTRLGFAVQDLVQVVQALRDAGAVVVNGPQQTAWGPRSGRAGRRALPGMSRSRPLEP
jgi:lactoylglutathione lyase